MRSIRTDGDLKHRCKSPALVKESRIDEGTTLGFQGSALPAAITARGMLTGFLYFVRELSALLGQLLAASMLDVSDKIALGFGIEIFHGHVDFLHSLVTSMLDRIAMTVSTSPRRN